jgi:hypothetical protein
MGIPHSTTLTITLDAPQVAGLELLLQMHLDYFAEDGTHKARMHDIAHGIYDVLAQADRANGNYGV